MQTALLTNYEGEHGLVDTIRALQAGGRPLDAVELGIREVERHPDARTVGYGGAPNAMGVSDSSLVINLEPLKFNSPK